MTNRQRMKTNRYAIRVEEPDNVYYVNDYGTYEDVLNVLLEYAKTTTEVTIIKFSENDI